MIRFINLTGQITLDDNDFYFAWYNTINSKFMSFDDQQIFCCWASFVSAFNEEESPYDELKRFEGLYMDRIKICEYCKEENI